jgi:hypothetical protein
LHELWHFLQITSCHTNDSIIINKIPENADFFSGSRNDSFEIGFAFEKYIFGQHFKNILNLQKSIIPILLMVKIGH